MKPKTRMLLALLGLLTAQPACSGSPQYYSAEAIEARVVDAETKQPLEGVVVVAHWQLFYSTVGGRVPGDQLMVLEAVTDKDGKFTFPAWGPKKVPKYKPQKGDVWIAHIPFLVPDSYLDERDPQLLLFKPGYEYRGIQNSLRSTTDPSPLRRSEWNGKTIEMKRFVDRPLSIGPHKYETSAYADHLSFLSTSLETVIDDCNWKKIPRMLLALKAQKDVFRGQGVRFSLIGADYVPTNPAVCGSSDEFFRNYRP